MSYWDILNIFFVLALLLGAMYGILFIMKKYLYSFGGKKNFTANIEIIAVQPILPKKYIAIVKIKDKIYLLGVSDQSVNLIDVIDDDGSFDKSIPKNKEQNFLEIFKKNLKL